MIGEFKIDKSFFGHILEAQLIAVAPYILASAVLFVLQYYFGVLLWATIPFWPLYTHCGLVGVAIYIGREKRDTETGLKLPAGSPKAWLLMWRRWSNLTDVAGPILAYGVGWAVYLLQ